MALIKSFLKHYEEEYDFYNQLSILAKDILEKEILGMGIKAIVTYRSKRVDSLAEKLYRRNATKRYQSFKDIEQDIIDLAGVRVALYFPSDRKIINKTIEELFIVKRKKEFPTDPQKPRFNKRFSGYWATHYRVQIKQNDKLGKKFTSKTIEIQVASVLMHAWSEVEHDLAYKPHSGPVSEDELAILDEINGLVLSGEIALDRLQKAYAERIKRKKEITNRYQLSLLFLNNFKNTDLSKIKLGDTSILNHYLEAVSKMKTDEILKSFEKVDLHWVESVTDQILMEIIAKDYGKNLEKYLSSFTTETPKVAVYERYIKIWIHLEKATVELNKQTSESASEITDLNFSNRLPTQLDAEEMADLKELRMLRNKLLHGYNLLSEEELKPSISRIKEISTHIIARIKDEKKRGNLIKELRNL